MLDFRNEKDIKATWAALAPAIGRLRSAGNLRDLVIDITQYFLLSVIHTRSIDDAAKLEAVLGVQCRYLRGGDSPFDKLLKLMDTAALIELIYQSPRPSQIKLTQKGESFRECAQHRVDLELLLDIFCSPSPKYAIYKRERIVPAAELKAGWTKLGCLSQCLLVLDIIAGFNMMRGAPISQEAISSLLVGASDESAKERLTSQLAELQACKHIQSSKEGFKVSFKGMGHLKRYQARLPS